MCTVAVCVLHELKHHTVYRTHVDNGSMVHLFHTNIKEVIHHKMQITKCK